jgi:hypothetical protein
MDLERINRLILRKQHLTEESKIDDIVQIADDLCGLHATSATTPYLSLFARTRSFNKDDLYNALYREKRLGRIRCMRNTIHILTREMISVALAATRDKAMDASRKFIESRGVSRRQYEEVSESIVGLLQEKEMTASEIKKALGRDGDISAILYLMCDSAVLIRGRPAGGWRSSNHKYALFEDYFPHMEPGKMGEREATVALVKKHVKSYGPAAVADIAWWAGLGKTRVREALDDMREDIQEIDVPDIKGRLCMFASDREALDDQAISKPVVNLLPVLDPYLMGYKQRERYLADEYYAYVFDRSGNGTSTILIDGRIVGIWDMEEDEEPTVKLFLFEEMPKKIRESIEARAREVGRFIVEGDVGVRWCDSMIPLTKRTAGSMMSPLKGC